MKQKKVYKKENNMNEQKLKIIIRIRPILGQQDSNRFIELEDDHTLKIQRLGNQTYMKFNRVLGVEASQKDLFSEVQDSVSQFLNGIDSTIFAYGQTGAGKTYSMIGDYSFQDSKQKMLGILGSGGRGILLRALQQIMLAKGKGCVRVSYYEIYNQRIFDLFDSSSVGLEIREGKNGEITIGGLLKVQVQSMEEAIGYLMIGLQNRATGCTYGNAKSSRSHSIFQVNLETMNENGERIHSSLRIVDLAGSQKFKIPSDLSAGEKEIRIQELTSINGSLSCLGHCISALIQKSRTHIPFRNSKLTRILSESLLGEGKMRFIICVSPSLSESAQTFSTLQFANRAKRAIFERSAVSSRLGQKNTLGSEEIEQLKKGLMREREHRIFLERELNNLRVAGEGQIMKQNRYLNKQNERLKKQLKQMIVKNNGMRDGSLKSCSYEDVLNDGVEKKNVGYGNCLKQEMLKLSIFQGNKIGFQRNWENASDKILRQKKQKQNFNNTRKKIELEKKIRKFIQSDSPPEQPQKGPISSIGVSKSVSKTVKQQKANKQSYFNDQHNKRSLEGVEHQKSELSMPSHMSSLWINNDESNNLQKAINGQYRRIEDGKTNEDFRDECWISNENTESLIEHACDKMDLPDFKQLRISMDKAKQDLVLFKRKDEQISMRKLKGFKIN